MKLRTRSLEPPQPAAHPLRCLIPARFAARALTVAPQRGGFTPPPDHGERRFFGLIPPSFLQDDCRSGRKPRNAHTTHRLFRSRQRATAMPLAQADGDRRAARDGLGRGIPCGGSRPGTCSPDSPRHRGVRRVCVSLQPHGLCRCVADHQRRCHESACGDSRTRAAFHPGILGHRRQHRSCRRCAELSAG